MLPILGGTIKDLRQSSDISSARKGDARRAILQFENLMIEELIDWVHISSHDMIELAP